MVLPLDGIDTNMASVKLGADLYEVEDIHGVTEGLTGSGNLNYLVLQSGQTDEMRRTADPFDIRQGNLWFPDSGLGGLNQGAHATPSALFGDTYGLGSNAASDAGNHSGLLRSASEDHFGASSLQKLNSYISDTQHDSSTLDLRTSDKAFSSILDRIHDGGNDGTNGKDGDGRDGRDGRDGKDGVSPEPPHDPPTPDPDPNPDSDTDLNVDLHDGLINTDLGVLLDPVEKLVGDIDINLNQNLNLSPILSGHLPEVGLSLDPLLLGTHLPLVDTAPILAPVTDGANGILDSLAPVTHPVLDTVTGLLPDDVTSIIGGMNTDGDSDLVLNLNGTALDLPLVQDVTSVPLDPLESITGDIDLTLDPHLSLLSGGGIAGLDLGGAFNGVALPEVSTNDIPNAVGDANGLLNTVIDQAQALDGGLLDPLAMPIDTLQAGLDNITDPLNQGLHPVLEPVNDLLGSVQGLGATAPDIANGLIDNIDHLTNIENDAAGTLDPVGDLLAGAQGGFADATGLLGQPFEGIQQAGGLLSDGLGPIVDGVLGGSPGGDTDLVVNPDIGVLDVPLLDQALAVPLDPVEALAGDIDLNLDPHVALLSDGGLASVDLGGVFNGASLHDINLTDFNDPVADVNAFTNTVIDQTQALDGGLLDPLASPVDHVQGLVDGVLNVASGIADPVIQAADDALNLSHSPIDTILGGDVCDPAGSVIDPNSAEGLLSHLADSLLGGLNSGDLEQDLTPHTSSLPVVTAEAGVAADAGLSLPVLHGTDTFGDLAQAVTGAAGGGGTPALPATQTPTLPDPIGHLSEGLSGVVDHAHSAGHHLIGGLFG